MGSSRYRPTMVSQETVAGRLHGVLTDLSQVRNASLAEAWARVLGADVTDRPAILRGIGVVATMPEAVEQSVLALPDATHELLLRWKPAVHAAMSVAHRLDSSANDMVANYNDATLLALEMVDDQVLRAHPHTHLEQDTIDRALERTSELLDALEGLDASAEVRSMLVRHALRLQEALRMYRLTGAQGVEDALADAAAVLAVTQKRAGGHPAWQAFAGVVGFVADALQIVSAVALLGPDIEQFVRLLGH